MSNVYAVLLRVWAYIFGLPQRELKVGSVVYLKQQPLIPCNFELGEPLRVISIEPETLLLGKNVVVENDSGLVQIVLAEDLHIVKE